MSVESLIWNLSILPPVNIISVRILTPKWQVIILMILTHCYPFLNATLALLVSLRPECWEIKSLFLIFQCLVILKSPLLQNQLLVELCCIFQIVLLLNRGMTLMLAYISQDFMHLSLLKLFSPINPILLLVLFIDIYVTQIFQFWIPQTFPPSALIWEQTADLAWWL